MAVVVRVTLDLRFPGSYFVLLFTPFFTMLDAEKGLKNR